MSERQIVTMKMEITIRGQDKDNPTIFDAEIKHRGFTFEVSGYEKFRIIRFRNRIFKYPNMAIRTEAKGRWADCENWSEPMFSSTRYADMSREQLIGIRNIQLAMWGVCDALSESQWDINKVAS